MAVVTKGEDGLAFMEAAVGHDCELAVVGSRSVFKSQVQLRLAANFLSSPGSKGACWV
jgi:hypothetical protein